MPTFYNFPTMPSLIGLVKNSIIRKGNKINSYNMQLWQKIKEKLETRGTKIKKPLVQYKINYQE